MRIIDKNTDFYDFYQNVYKDDIFTFDRRDSYILTKEMMCDAIRLDKHFHWNWRKKEYERERYKFVLLQICNTFWLFLIEVTSADNFDRPKDYKIELLSRWKDFDKQRELCKLDMIELHFYFFRVDRKEKIYQYVEDMKRDIHTNHFKYEYSFNHAMVYSGDKKVEKHIPLLKACGISNLIDAHEVYLAFEEYFALEKSDSERREPLGTTDIDKVESHGFDKKTSFRGK